MPNQQVYVDRTPGQCRPLLDQSDLYGIGVRVGTYTQWLSTILTVCLVHDPKKRSGMRNVNYAFAFAEWVALVNQTRSIWPADAVIVAFLFMGTITLLSALEIFDRLRPRRARRNDPPAGKGGELARITLLAAFIIWVIWWWYAGIYHTLRDCGLKIFYFGGPVRVFGDFKLIGRIWAPLLLVMLIPVFDEFFQFGKRSYRQYRELRLAHPLVMASEAQRSSMKAEMYAAGPTDPMTMEFWEMVFTDSQAPENIQSGTIENPKTKQRRGLYCAILLGIGVFVLIIFIEIMLAYGDVKKINEISGVGDTIPMVIGCGDMLMILWKLKQQRQKEIEKARRQGDAYRYPKTFLYDAKFPLIKWWRGGWSRVTGRPRSDQAQDGQQAQSGARPPA